MATGTIKWFNDAKGFGFITPDDESGDVFVHYSTIIGQSGRRTLLEGERVEYEVIEGPKGLQAMHASRTCARVDDPPGHTMSLGSCHIHSLEALRSFNRLIFDLLAL